MYSIRIKIYRNIPLSVVLYGCETWPLTSSKEKWVRVSENRALRKLFGSKRDEVTVEWRRLHNEELHDLYCTHYCGDKTEEDTMGWACVLYREEKYI